MSLENKMISSFYELDYKSSLHYARQELENPTNDYDLASLIYLRSVHSMQLPILFHSKELCSLLHLEPHEFPFQVLTVLLYILIAQSQVNHAQEIIQDWLSCHAETSSEVHLQTISKIYVLHVLTDTNIALEWIQQENRLSRDYKNALIHKVNSKKNVSESMTDVIDKPIIISSSTTDMIPQKSIINPKSDINTFQYIIQFITRYYHSTIKENVSRKSLFLMILAIISFYSGIKTILMRNKKKL